MKRTSLLAFALAIGISASAFGSSPVTEDFTNDSDGTWDGMNNRIDSPFQNYGWSNTDFTGTDVNPPGGTATGAGELGGILTRADAPPVSFYGFDVGGLLSTEAFEAHGVIRLVSRGGSSGYVLGFFNETTSFADSSDPDNFVGFYFDDGHVTYAFPNNTEIADDGQEDPGGGGGGVTVPFSIMWNGAGSMTTSIGGSVPLVQSASFSDPMTHFGIAPVNDNGGSLEVYLDDLTFSANTGGLPGDVNNDGFVDIFDINLVSANWGSPGGPTGDANNDGNVDIFDINLISANWAPAPGSAAAVPEPASAVLAALSVFGLVCAAGARSRRRVQR